jgi:hypothetical protein
MEHDAPISERGGWAVSWTVVYGHGEIGALPIGSRLTVALLKGLSPEGAAVGLTVTNLGFSAHNSPDLKAQLFQPR